MSRRRILSVLLLGTSLWPAWAQVWRPQAVKVVAPHAPLPAAHAAILEVPLLLEIASTFHINADKPTFDYLVPTKLEWTSRELKLLAVEYPAAASYTFSFSPGKPIEVYQGAVNIRSRFQVPRGAAPGKLTLHGKLRYQACDDKTCYPPVTVNVEAPVQIVKTRKKQR